MPNDTNSNYGYDPFASSDTSSRWGRKAPAGVTVPEIENYEIRDNIGSGGMGSVWVARYIPLNQIRAVKVLDKALAADPSFIDRFSQEARALGRLQHPNVVKVFDANPEHVPPYIALQWVDGKPLSKVMGKQPMPYQEAIKILEQVAAALDYAHSMGFIHRDIKPSNVMITEKGDAMLIDFGIASWMGYDPTSAHTLTGTTRYLSPEVIQGRPVTAASDVWAFCVLVYRMLTGHLPFDDSNSDAVLKKIVDEEPTDAKIAGRLRKFLVEMLEKDPKKRYKSAGEVVAELKKASLAWVPKVEKEKVAAGGAITMFIGIGAFAVISLGAIVYSVFNHPVTPSAQKFNLHLKQQVAALGASLVSTVPATNVAPLVEELKGPWFADLGQSWIEAYLDPAGGSKFRMVTMTRSSVGTVTVDEEGSIEKDEKSIAFEDKDVIANPNQITRKPLSFKGTVSGDHASISGIFGGETTRFVRVADLLMSPYENQTLGVSTQIPEGWTATPSDEGSAKVVSISPEGNANVAIRISVEPATPTTNLVDLFTRREMALQADKSAGGDYVRLSTNDSASLGGVKSSLMQVRHQVSGQPSMKAQIYGFLRSNSSVFVEFWSPSDQDQIWAPVLERIRAKFAFADQ